jgi:glycosyltransferase involved in cell wall biosynthesis
MSGAPIRTYNILRQLCHGNDVSLCSTASLPEHQLGIKHLQALCKEVEGPSKKPIRLSSLYKNIPITTPIELVLTYSSNLSRSIKYLTQNLKYDIIQIEHASMGHYLELIPETMRKKSIWMLHDIDFAKFRRISIIEKNVIKKFRYYFHSVLMKKWMANISSKFGLCVTVSRNDKLLLKRLNKNINIVVSPNGVDTDTYKPLPENDGKPIALFIGNMAYNPNADAVRHFCKYIFPRVKLLIPKFELFVIGNNPSNEIKMLDGDSIHITGKVDDLQAFYELATLCIVPIRAGSGTRLKILEAMAFGRPVVSYPIGCEGLDVIQNENILIAKDQNEFADMVIKLATDTTLRKTISKNARKLVEDKFSWKLIASRLHDEYQLLIDKTY